MKIQALTPMLRTWDLRATVEFYTVVLGFVCESQTDEWASLRRDGVGLMVSAPTFHEKDTVPAFTGSLYFRTGHVDEFWIAVKDRARVCYPIETFGYGMREFGIYDNNGYLLQFGQPMPAK
jgi:catechol 2,3-dioxygenase-like lactoylglutathione lyase family enzyme